MTWLKRIFDFYLDASIHVAIALYSLLQITALTLNLPYDYHLSFFVFFGTISSYNFIKYGVEAEKYILVSNQYQRGIQLLSFLALGMALYHCHFLNLNVLIAVAGIVVLTALYALPVLPQAKNLRSWGGLKVIIVALVWAITTVILPILNANQIVNWNAGVETFQRFVFVLILLIPFEIRDMGYDDPAMKTFPQRFGATNTIILGVFATVVFFASTFLKNHLSIREIIVKLIMTVLLGLVLILTNRKHSKYFASFWVEAVPIVWGALIVLLP